jgi:hypothetical protein
MKLLEFDLPKNSQTSLKEVTVSFLVDTKSTDKDIFYATQRGIYYGLDVKRVATPGKITISKIDIK